MDKKERIVELIKEMDTPDVVSIYNEYCEKRHYEEDMIFPIEYFNERCEDMTPLQIAEYAKDGFDPDDDYFVETVYGFKSFSYWEDYDMIDVDEIAEYIAENEVSLGNDDIEDILEEEEEEE